MRRRHRRLVDAIEAKVGPFTGGDVLILRGDPGADLGAQLCEELTQIAKERGLAGSQWASEYVPLIVQLGEGASLELLDEDDMRAAGWVWA